MSFPAIPVNLPPALPPPVAAIAMDQTESLAYTAPSNLGRASTAAAPRSNETCPICLDDLAQAPAVQITQGGCSHAFHQSCIMDTWNHHGARCPVCRIAVGEPQGRCPSGTMECTLLQHRPCPGFSHCQHSIQIRYHIPSGTQLAYHEHPGQAHQSAIRTAYLPDTKEGRDLLVRTQYAFLHGLLFTVGTSLTTGVPNSVVWSSVHQKTSLNGGPHGFPDPAFLANCHASLDALNVPSPQDILQQHPTTSNPVPSRCTYQAPASLSSSSGLQRYLRTYQPALILHDDDENVGGDSTTNAATTLVEPPQGHSPSGSMSMEILARPCPGFDDAPTTIQIVYYMPSSTQRAYHPSPGTSYPDTTRIAYLPNNADGCQLLCRLKYAWTHGLTFTVGTSLTTGRPNSVVWTSIPHKTDLNNGGPYGYPDDEYLRKCHAALALLRVPPAHLCVL